MLDNLKCQSLLLFQMKLIVTLPAMYIEDTVCNFVLDRGLLKLIIL